MENVLWNFVVIVEKYDKPSNTFFLANSFYISNYLTVIVFKTDKFLCSWFSWLKYDLRVDNDIA